MWLNYLILLSNITAYYYCNIIIVHIIIIHIIIVFTLLMEAIHLDQSINILWIINCKYYRYIASYSSLSMTYAVNKGGQLFRRGQYCTGILLPPGAVIYRYIIAPGSFVPVQYCPPAGSGEAVLYRYTGAPSKFRVNIYRDIPVLAGIGACPYIPVANAPV